MSDRVTPTPPPADPEAQPETPRMTPEQIIAMEVVVHMSAPQAHAVAGRVIGALERHGYAIREREAAEQAVAPWRELAQAGIEAFRLTREYVAPSVGLPAEPGWEWFDWTERARRLLESAVAREPAKSRWPLHAYDNHRCAVQGLPDPPPVAHADDADCSACDFIRAVRRDAAARAVPVLSDELDRERAVRRAAHLLSDALSDMAAAGRLRFDITTKVRHTFSDRLASQPASDEAGS